MATQTLDLAVNSIVFHAACRGVVGPDLLHPHVGDPLLVAQLPRDRLDGSFVANADGGSESLVEVPRERDLDSRRGSR